MYFGILYLQNVSRLHPSPLVCNNSQWGGGVGGGKKLAEDVKSQFPTQPQVPQSHAVFPYEGEKPPRPIEL